LLRADLVLDALGQALYARTGTEGLIHHSDRGRQNLSIRYTERLAEAQIEASIGNIPPVEFEAAYYEQENSQAMAA
jgi:transposase InsO family protein